MRKSNGRRILIPPVCPNLLQTTVLDDSLRPNIPGHALHEKSLQRQEGDGTLVSSREQKALLVPVINRLSTAGFVPPSVYIGFRLFVLPGGCSGQLSSMPWGARGTVASSAKKPVGVQPCRARSAQPPRRAPPDPTRPWCVRVLDSTNLERWDFDWLGDHHYATRTKNCSPGRFCGAQMHSTIVKNCPGVNISVRSAVGQWETWTTWCCCGCPGAGRRAAGRRGGAGPGKVGRRRDHPPRNLQPSCFPRLPRHRFPDMPCMKWVYKTKKATVHWSAARNKERLLSKR